MRQVEGSRLVAEVETLNALADMLGVSSKSLKLKKLFSTNESGWSNASAFHSSCDDKGPTIVLIRSSDGSRYGGYTSVSWESNGDYRHDSQAFLFRLSPQPGQGTQHVSTQKFGISPGHQKDAQSSPQNQGPTFGAGNDLRTFTTSGIALSMNPFSYPTSAPLIQTSVPKNENNFQLEVLQVIVHPSGKLEVPWLADVAWATKVCTVTLADCPNKARLDVTVYIRLHAWAAVSQQSSKSHLASRRASC